MKTNANAADQAGNQQQTQGQLGDAANGNGQSRGAAAPTPAPAASSCTVQPDGSVLLIKPRLELQGDLHWDRTDIRTMSKTWNPERALIVGSVLIIEEWKVVIPIAYVHVARWDYKAPTVPAAT